MLSHHKEPPHERSRRYRSGTAAQNPLASHYQIGRDSKDHDAPTRAFKYSADANQPPRELSTSIAMFRMRVVFELECRSNIVRARQAQI